MSDDKPDDDNGPTEIKIEADRFWLEEVREKGDGEDVMEEEMDDGEEVMEEEHHKPRMVRIEWYSGSKSDDDQPFEAVGINIPEDVTEERFAIKDGIGTVEEHIKEHIELHINGECKCVGGDDE